MSMSTAGADDEPMMDINTTPLIDVMLVLLIMFIITIPVQSHAVKLDLPVNQPRVQVNAYQFDGPMAYLHSGDQPTYVTNSYGLDFPAYVHASEVLAEGCAADQQS